MICKSCGNICPDGEKFCNNCGSPLDAAPVFTPPAVQVAPENNAPSVPSQKKKGKGALIAVIAVLATLIVAVGVVFALHVFEVIDLGELFGAEDSDQDGDDEKENIRLTIEPETDEATTDYNYEIAHTTDAVTENTTVFVAESETEYDPPTVETMPTEYGPPAGVAPEELGWRSLIDEYDALLGEIMEYAELYPDAENMEDLPEEVQERVEEIENALSELEDELEAIIDYADEETAYEIVSAFEEMIAKYETGFEEDEASELQDWETLVEEYDALFGELMEYAELYPDVENMEDLPEDVRERVVEIENAMSELEDEIDAILEYADEETAYEIVSALQEMLDKYEDKF